MDRIPEEYQKERDWVHRETPFFSTKQEIEEKKGKFKKGRFRYLQSLVTEFQDTDDIGKNNRPHLLQIYHLILCFLRYPNL